MRTTLAVAMLAPLLAGAPPAAASEADLVRLYAYVRIATFCRAIPDRPEADRIDTAIARLETTLGVDRTRRRALQSTAAGSAPEHMVMPSDCATVDERKSESLSLADRVNRVSP
jgi:hypothetical protein